MGYASSDGLSWRSVFRALPVLLLAVGLLLLGLLAVPGSEVPAGTRAESWLVSATFLVTGGALAATLWWPTAGGWLTCVAAVLFGVVLNAFRLSTLIMPARPVGYSPFFSIVMTLVMVLGVLSIVRGRRQRRTRL